MAKVDIASGEIEKEVSTDCTKCKYFESCESGKQRYSKLSGVNCRSFEGGVTNYSRFMSKSVEELAEYINEHDEKLCDKICYDKTIAKNKDCPYGELEDTEKCKGCIKEWLLSEVQE